PHYPLFIDSPGHVTPHSHILSLHDALPICDVASFLRNDLKDSAGNANPLATSAASVGIKRIYATGASQTGGYLRDFIYLGFNEEDRKSTRLNSSQSGSRMPSSA